MQSIGDEKINDYKHYSSLAKQILVSPKKSVLSSSLENKVLANEIIATSQHSSPYNKR